MRIRNARTRVPQLPIVSWSTRQHRRVSVRQMWLRWVNTAGSLPSSTFLTPCEARRTGLFPSPEEGWGRPHPYCSLICGKLGCDPACLDPAGAFGSYHQLSAPAQTFISTEVSLVLTCGHAGMLLLGSGALSLAGSPAEREVGGRAFRTFPGSSWKWGQVRSLEAASLFP